MPMEYERVFLVAEMPDLKEKKMDRIEQHYLSNRPGCLRLRKQGDSYELTKKIQVPGGDSHDKEERNLPIDRGDFLEQRKLSKRMLTKKRYYLPIAGDLTAEVNVYTGKLAGLELIEVEFPTPRAKSKFKPPAWFGRDVTNEPWAKNSWLAGKTYKQVKAAIK